MIEHTINAAKNKISEKKHFRCGRRCHKHGKKIL